jgi:hypothetical protein
MSTGGSWWYESITTEDIILDHNSISWSTGKLLGVWHSGSNMSFTNNILSEPLMDCHNKCEGTYITCNTVADPSGECGGDACVDACPRSGHNYGVLFGPGTDHVTFAHNIIAHASYRNPLYGGGEDRWVNLAGSQNNENINNVVYNGRYWGGAAINRNKYKDSDYNPSGDDGAQNQDTVWYGDYHKAGPDTSSTANYFTSAYSESYAIAEGTPYDFVENDTNLYSYGNRSSAWSESDDEYDFFRQDGSFNENIIYSSGWPFTPSNVVATDATTSYNALIVTNDGMIGSVPVAGAYPRDSVDEAVITDIQSGTAYVGTSGGWITDEDESSASTGADWYPTYSAGSSPTDNDEDGIPASYEATLGTSDSDASDAHDDHDGDGYTNIEEYINSFFE